MKLRTLTTLALVVFVLNTTDAQTNRFLDPAGADAGDCSDFGAPCQTIDYAVSQSSNGDAIYLSDGTFPAATISQRLTLKGNGTGTIVQGLTINAAVSSSDLVLVSDLTVSGTTVGVLITTSYVTLQGLNVSDHTSRNVSLSVSGDITDITVSDCVLDGGGITNTGLHISEATGVDRLNVLNTSMNNSTFGMYFTNGSAATLNHVENVVVRNCTFNNNLRKGIYVEKLQNALFENISVINSGTDATYGFNNGIDINLKWQPYTGITIRNSRIVGCGAIGLNDIGTAPENRRSSAVTIKARTDASSYNVQPASLSNVTLDGVIIDGLVTDLRFGEMGKTDNDGIDMSTVTVSHCSITNDNLSGLLNEENTNSLTISNNYWGGVTPSVTDIEDYGSGAGSTIQSNELVNLIVDELNNSYTSFANALAGVAADGVVQNIPIGTVTGTTTISKNVTLSTPGAGLLDATNSLTTFENLVVSGGVLSLGSDFAASTSITLTDDVVIGDYNVTGAAVTINSGASIQDGIDMITSGGTVTVGSGTYAESLIINTPLTLDGSAGALLEPVSLATAIDVDSDNVIIDGFQIGTDGSNSNATIGINSFRNDNITIRNNTIFANSVGISYSFAETGTSLLNANTIQMLAVEDANNLTNGSVGIALSTISGDADADITNNDITNAGIGISTYALTSSAEAIIDGGIFTGCTAGIIPINTNGSGGFSPSALTIQNVTMSGFVTNTDVVSPDTEVGVYVVAAGGTAADDITITMDNLDISGVGNGASNGASNNAGIIIGDFPSASDGAGIAATITNCNIHDNSNRGIYTRGADAVTNVTQTSITGNGFDPFAMNSGNPGFSVIARDGSSTTVANCFITNPATLSSAEDIPNDYYVSGLHISTGGSLTVSDCSFNDNSNGFIAETSGIDLSGNFFTSTVEATIDAAVGSNDFTPWLSDGTDTDLVTNGFQGDFSSLIVGVSGAQTGSSGRIEEGIGLVDASGTVLVNAGTYAENLTIAKSITLNGANQGIAGSGTRSAESIIEPSSANVGITIGADDITIDGFQFGTDNANSNHTTAISNTGFTGFVADNNRIFANASGILLNGITSGTSSASNNYIEMLGLANPLLTTAPSVGLIVFNISSSADVDLMDNDISTATYGIATFGLTSSAISEINGGTYSGCTIGISSSNFDGSASFSASSLSILNVTMSGFAGPDGGITGASGIPQAGIYAFTTASAPSTDHDVTITADTVDISGVGNGATDHAGILAADFFNTDPDLEVTDDKGISLTVSNSNIHDNANRGVHSRGADAVVTINTSSIANNSNAGGVVFAKGTLNVNNTFVVLPSAGATSGLLAQTDGQIVANGSSFDLNGNVDASTLIANIQDPAGDETIDLSGSWLTATDETTIVSLLDESDTDFSPWLGSSTDFDGVMIGFQPDSSALNVGLGGSQSTGLLNEAHDFLSIDGTINISAGTYSETFTVSKNVFVAPASGTSIDDVVLNGGNLGVTGTAFTVNNSLTMTSGVFDIDQEDGNKSDDPVFVLPTTVNGSSYASDTHFEGRIEASVTGGSSFVFEVGDEGAYRPVTLTPTTTTTFQVAHITGATPIGGGATNPDIINLIGDVSPDPSGTIESVLNGRYWDIDVSAGGPPGSTNVALQINGGDRATDPSSLGMTRFDGSDWEIMTLVSAAGSDPFVITATTTNFSEFSIYSTDVNANPLPVELVDFVGRIEDRDIMLSWSTMSEVNSNYFQVEHSGDGFYFNPIGRVVSHGNSNERIDYEFMDSNVKTGIHYYRLKMVDFDGSYEHSEIIQITPDLSDLRVLVYPNPTTDFIHIEGVETSHLRQLAFYDLNGKLFKSLTSIESPQISISDLPKGQYLMRFEMVDGSVFEGKILKK